MTSQEHPQARFLATLADHLARFPHLSLVNVGSDNVALQLTYDGGGVGPANSVLQWARTLTEPSIVIGQVESSLSRGDWTKVAAKGKLDDFAVIVWSADRHDLYRWVDQDLYETPLDLDRLAAYVAAGTVDGVVS